MFCDRCGAKLDDTQSFCPSCGKSIRPQVAPVTGNRVANHVRLLGILWLAIAAVRLVPSLAVIALINGGLTFLPPDVPPFVMALIRFGGILFLAAAIVSFLIGYGLLTWKPWARMLAIIAGGLSLLDIPFGTVLGIYSLWTLLPESSEKEYQAKAHAALNFGPV